MGAEQRTTQILETSMGNLGSELIGTVAATIAAPYKYTALQFISDSIVSVATDAVGASNVDLTGFTVILAGTVIYGKWSAITLTSGEGIAYIGEK